MVLSRSRSQGCESRLVSGLFVLLKAAQRGGEGIVGENFSVCCNWRIPCLCVCELAPRLTLGVFEVPFS